ncbi:Protein GPR107 [Hypsibius exemplaris]|uniref:Protein GPR107 n=1 Tax=Hypsibius exemplaris TaxID=2072580 RepID=A0A9X6NA81_HYPEX|nr:Protein GPR107 [Hypsibius exemplaris]
MISLRTFTLLVVSVLSVDCRIHKLDLSDEDRPYILVTSFGFRKGGLLTLTAWHLNISASESGKFDVERDGKYGFTIDKSRNFEMATYFEKNQDKCIFDVEHPPPMDNSSALITGEFVLTHGSGIPRILLKKWGKTVETVQMFSCSQKLVTDGLTDQVLRDEMDKPSGVNDTSQFVTGILAEYPELRNCSSDLKDGLATMIQRPSGNGKKYLFSLAFYISDFDNEGAYSVVFHNCPNYGMQKVTTMSVTVHIVERNGNDYLSVGERLTPAVYFIFAALFFATGIVWASVLRTADGDVFKLHYVMLVLIFFKATSLLCHGINFHFISKLGAPLEGWAILFYVTHLLKGALLFITLVLIGTGWAFIKNFLTSKEKKVFLVVIPLQVLANIAWIILEESEAGDYKYTMWSYVFMFVDFFCCGCILIPIVWSIRHLSEAAETDGKAASSLQRMKLFRRFYMLVVCYIYFTRIVVMIFNMTIPFRYTYMNSVFQEGGTFIFFVLTGYTFRPTLENPYLRLSTQGADDEEDPDDPEMDDVVVFDQNRVDRVMMRTSNAKASAVVNNESEKGLLSHAEERT